jgi:hypothetical protein
MILCWWPTSWSPPRCLRRASTAHNGQTGRARCLCTRRRLCDRAPCSYLGNFADKSGGWNRVRVRFRWRVLLILGRKLNMFKTAPSNLNRIEARWDFQRILNKRSRLDHWSQQKGGDNVLSWCRLMRSDGVPKKSSIRVGDSGTARRLSILVVV